MTLPTGSPFISVDFNFFWTGTVDESNSSKATMCNFWTGGCYAQPKGAPYHVWPVLGGNNWKPEPPYPSPVPKTGQTTSYEPGDDGDLQKGVE